MNVGKLRGMLTLLHPSRLVYLTDGVDEWELEDVQVDRKAVAFVIRRVPPDPGEKRLDPADDHPAGAPPSARGT